MLARLSLISAGFILLVLSGAEASEHVGSLSPAWTRDAYWYRVAIPRFRNGEASNDPQDTLPWTAQWKSLGGDASPNAIYREDDSWRYGGDLQGLRSKLPYLKTLGVNALCLSPVFSAPSDHKYDPADLRHVDDSLAVAGSLGEISGETGDPATWQFSGSDRLFLDFIKEAHAQGIRVIVEGVFSQGGRESWAWQDVLRRGRESPYADWFEVTSWTPRLGWVSEKGVEGKLIRYRRSGDGLSPGVEKYLVAITRRWMDPNGDGDPSEGIDGWLVVDAGKLPRGTVKTWREYLKNINPDGILVGDFSGGPGEAVAGEYDLIIDYDLSDSIRRFFTVENQKYSLEALFGALTSLQERQSRGTRSATIMASSGPTTGRLLFALSPGLTAARGGGTSASPASPHGAARDRWRLATTLQYLCVGAPMTYYGDEVGMYAPAGPDVRAPMWWADLPDPATKSAGYRADFLALVRQLHGLRERFAPLRHGDFRVVLQDEKRQLLAFARTLPGDEVIVVMNYGGATQEVTLTVGRPRQLVGVVTPELRPGAPHPLFKPKRPVKGSVEIPRLRLGGSRRYADDFGAIELSVKPKSIRLVVVRDR